MKKFSTLFFALLLTACNAPADPYETPTDGPEPQEEEVEIQSLNETDDIPTETGYYSWGSEVDSPEVSIEDDMLTLNVGYGGCGKKDFTLSWDGMIPETDNMSLYLSLPVVTGMECEMYISDTLKFDLTPVKEAIQDHKGTETGEVTLYLTKPGSTEEPLTVEYSF